MGVKNIASAISENLLPRVRQPSQYIALETNARMGDVHAARVTVALAFPDAYTIGISHLGHQTLYHTLNDLPGVACDRAYCPLPDAEAVMLDQAVPLFGWESRCAISDFDIVGFSLSYELCVTNVLTMLSLAGVPILARDRSEKDPIIVGGDALADSPEPLADFFDVFLPGDGEDTLPALVKLIDKMKSALPGEVPSRLDRLRRIAREVPSAYVPQLYEPVRPGLGAVRPIDPDIPAQIGRAMVRDLSSTTLAATTRPLVPLAEAVHERVVIEVMRGCPNLCKFCQAGHTRLPVRRRGVEEIVSAVLAGLKSTGYNEVSLLSLSTSDYPQLEGLIERLNAELAGRHVSISLPSLRVDSQLQVLPKLTAAVRKGGLTIAAEAGTEQLRASIGKKITEADMLAGVRAAWQAGYKSVKVYFMAGLPGETLEDIDQIYWLCRRLSNTRRDVDGHRGAITASVSWFVPKPHTPMQWEPMQKAEYFFEVRSRLIDLARRSPITVKFHRIEQSLLEALLCRGGREVGQVVLRAWQGGARMDSWNEHWNWEIWQEAIKAAGVDFDAIVHRPLPTDQPLPWSHISCHLDENSLLGRRER
jgi:radical SAM family uncharacterized protein